MKEITKEELFNLNLDECPPVAIAESIPNSVKHKTVHLEFTKSSLILGNDQVSFSLSINANDLTDKEKEMLKLKYGHKDYVNEIGGTISSAIDKMNVTKISVILSFYYDQEELDEDTLPTMSLIGVMNDAGKSFMIGGQDRATLANLFYATVPFALNVPPSLYVALFDKDVEKFDIIANKIKQNPSYMSMLTDTEWRLVMENGDYYSL